MVIWKNEIDIVALNRLNAAFMPGHLGIEIIEIGDDYIKATMPIDHRTKQPMGLLHGGASAALSETIGSIASILTAGTFGKFSIVGIEINANHLKAGKSGVAISITKPVKIGRTLHVWNTEIFDDTNEILCVSRLTVLVKEN
jgi:1,4-dihydroxy-2-naphthoyl-CoA hydrolase